jgi:hydroxymethylpyrimidine/phosphomethylpyrimidine kinase
MRPPSRIRWMVASCFPMTIAQPPKLLTIGGSDSGGAAGIQADLKTWTALSVYGMSVITAVTAQNSVAVEAIQYIQPGIVAAQIDAVLSDYGAQALKTGFLGRAELVEVVAARFRSFTFGPIPILIDPVLVNHKGLSMFGPEVAATYAAQLLPLADLATPNWREAALLAGLDAETLLSQAGLEHAAAQLGALGCKQVLITGVPAGEQVIDWYYDGTRLHPLPQALIETDNRHGSGDTLSAAICAYLAQGVAMPEAIVLAQAYTARALRDAASWHLGRGHGPLAHFVPLQRAR